MDDVLHLDSFLSVGKGQRVSILFRILASGTVLTVTVDGDAGTYTIGESGPAQANSESAREGRSVPDESYCPPGAYLGKPWRY